MNCPICHQEGKEIFTNKILYKYDISYFQCPNCKLIYTEKPYWLQEAYQDAIVGTDTGIMQRNISFCILVNALIKHFFPEGRQFLDYGGGYGIFVRLMRDLGHQFRWMDKYSENLVARGFEYLGEDVALVTAFELFEHFDKPVAEFENLLRYSKNILISTTVYTDKEGYPDKDWWYYAPHAGQHIVFYHAETFRYLVKQYQLHYYQINDTLHLMTEKKLPEGKFNLLIKSKFGKLCQYIEYFLQKRYALCESDSKSIMEKNR